ncbi:hypothetical protein ACLMJK_004558 [Lecanora helva]
MHQTFPFGFLALLVLLSSVSLSHGDTTFSQQTCTTKLGTVSVPNVSSTTFSVTIPLTLTQKSTSTPTKTITPGPSSTTITATTQATQTTTDSTITDTFSTTSTIVFTTDVTTITGFQTQTVTTTTTVTSGSPTTTIPTAAGFTPIASEAGFVPRFRRRTFDLPKRAAAPPANSVVRVDIAKGGKVVSSPTLYPAAVSCVKLVEIIKTSTVVSTAKTTATTTAPAVTNTATRTLTLTSTSTVVPHASVTNSFTDTATISSTASTIITTTVTATATATEIVAPTATHYAACAANNIVSAANGGGDIIGWDIDQRLTPNSNIPNIGPQACCEACQRTANCASSIAFPDNQGCSLLIANTCNPGSTFGNKFYSRVGWGIGATLSNGPCGQFGNGGAE